MLFTADRVVLDGVPRANIGVLVGEDGRIRAIDSLAAMGNPDRVFDGRVLVPGFVNGHSHAFQRVLRGRTQRATPNSEDDFWSWREAMYRAAAVLDPERMYVAARQAFLEMVLSGVTTVGEFHYVHHQPDGRPYDDSAAMAVALARAAADVGMRICLLRTTYLQGDFDREPDALQRRFCDPSLDVAWTRMEELVRGLRQMHDPRITWGVAAHSIRAVPLDAMVGMKACATHLPMHIHVSEQRREVDGCMARYGRPPIELLVDRGVVDGGTTLVHATHPRLGEVEALGRAGAVVCVCPSTEADLGDGLGPVGDLFAAGVELSVGTDGQTLTSVLAEAGRLEMHERLRCERRNVLADSGQQQVALTALRAATLGGARALQMDVGAIEPGRYADLVAFNLDDPHLVGLDDESLMAGLIFSADTRAITDVIVGGVVVVQDGFHPLAELSAGAFASLTREVFA